MEDECGNKDQFFKEFNDMEYKEKTPKKRL